MQEETKAISEVSVTKIIEEAISEVTKIIEEVDQKDVNIKGEEGVDKKDVLEDKSRDFIISVPSKRESKKKSEATTSQASSSSSVTLIQAGHDSPLFNFKFIYHENQHGHYSPIANFKFILGVALICIIFGIIIGKRF